MDKQEYLKKWAEKLSLSLEEIEGEFNSIFEEEKNIHVDLSEDEQQKRALQRLSLMYKRQLNSPAIGFEGIVIGVSEVIDINQKRIREAKELFKVNPQLAVIDGVTDEEGNPLDNRKEWSGGRLNPSFGKLLPEYNYLRNIFGIVKRTKGDTPPRFFQMTLSGEKAKDDSIPIFQPIRFMAIDKSITETVYKLNSSTFTKFLIDTNLDMPTYEKLMDDYIGVRKISELKQYHDSNKEDFNRIVVVEGDVSLMNLEPNAYKNRVLILEDSEISLDNLDARGLTCWIPERIKINFAESSKVLVIGRTAQGKKKDDQGNVTEELSDVSMNVFGVYAIPEYKINLPEEIKTITEDNLKI